VPLLAEQVAAFRQETDSNYVANCALALSELTGLSTEDRSSASQALIAALEAPSVQVRYAAATALKELWKKGAAAGERETIRKVNAALVAALFEATTPAEVYGPGLALFEINGIRLSAASTGMQRPASLSPQELKETVARWASDNPQLLPPMEEQPWPLLLATVRLAGTGAARAQARRLLIRRRPLNAVDALIRYLAAPGLSEAMWKELGDILSEISGVPFPPAAATTDREALVALWMKQWDEHLKTQKDEAHRLYSWQRFERAVAASSIEPTDEMLTRLRQLRQIIIWQFDGPDKIPQDASPTAKEMVSEVLQAKARFLAALSGLKQATEHGQKLGYVKKLQEVAQGPDGKIIVRQSLGEFVGILRAEERLQVLNTLAALLTKATGVPLQFPPGQSAEERRNMVDEWLKKVQQYEAATGTAESS